MPYIFDPRRSINLWTSPDFKSGWKVMTPKPVPGMMLGTGWLTTDWINDMGHKEGTHQKCFIYHWPKDLVPAFTLNDPIGELNKKTDKILEAIKLQLELSLKVPDTSPGPPDKDGNPTTITNPHAGTGVTGSVDVIKLFQGISEYFSTMFTLMGTGPLKDLPLSHIRNHDQSLTYIYAEWYEGTPSRLDYVVNWGGGRTKQLKIWNKRFWELVPVQDEALKLSSMFVLDEVQIPIEPLHDLSGDLPSGNLILLEEDQLEGRVYQSLQGTLAPRFAAGGTQDYALLRTGSTHELAILQSGDLDLSRLPYLPDQNLVEVTGELQRKGNEVYIRVDAMQLLMIADTVLYPPIVFSEDELLVPAMSALATATCPPDIRKMIIQQAQQIKTSTQNLQTIEWKKYGSIGIMVVSLLASTVSLATGILSFAVGAAPISMVTTTIIISKLTALAGSISSLINLDSWAKNEFRMIEQCKKNLENLKKTHPACFK